MNLTLYIPGLFGPAARFSEEFIPQARALEFILGRAAHAAFDAPSYHAGLGRLFGVEAPEGRDLPIGAITRLIDADEYAAGCWMRADPVHLRADRHGLTLLDARALNLDMREALALSAELRDLTEREGWRLEVPHPDRWYAQLPGEPALHTQELDTVVGRDVGRALPAGADAARFHSLLNEIQMRLHHGEVNRLREARGFPPANSLWPWGIGAMPAPVAPRWWKVYADDVSARAFARFSGSPCAPLPAGAYELPDAAGAEPLLAVIDVCKRHVEYQDLQAWHDALLDLETRWFAPCVDLLRAGALRLVLIAGGARHVLTRAARYFFWRRPVRLADGV